jgi:TetR/AcrR family transcriptional regulator, cholesterol catabolism regulator
VTDISAPVGRSPRPRQRIIDAARHLAARGGYESVQVRALAACAGVSSYTIYAHFSSLESLLIAAVDEQSQHLYRRDVDSPLQGRTAVARVDKLTADLTETMNASRNLTIAWLRAVVSGKPDVAPWVPVVMDALQTQVATAIAPHGPTSQDREVAEILGNIWFSVLVGWATGIHTKNQITKIMRRSARALLVGG